MIEPVINANYANFGHIPYGQSLVSVLQKAYTKAWNNLRQSGCTVIIASAHILTYLFFVSLRSQIGTIYFDAENPDMCQKSKPEALKEMVEDASGDK